MASPKYYINWNTPGCLPDEPPMEADTCAEARRLLADLMREDADCVEDNDDLEKELRAEADRVEAGDGEYGATIGRWFYSVTLV